MDAGEVKHDRKHETARWSRIKRRADKLRDVVRRVAAAFHENGEK
jgi:hypothetical protein